MARTVFTLESAPGVLASSLEQVQKTTSNHRKNVNVVYRLFQQCATVTERLGSGKTRLSGEKAFVELLKEAAINRVLVVKRGVANADRVVKFISGFIAYAIEQQQQQQQNKQDEGEQNQQAATDGAASRLTSNILRYLLKGFTAKDKNVRFRSVQFVATMINGLGELDDSDYEALLESLLERVKDKEAPIRVQAAVALAKLQNPEELDDGSLVFREARDDDEDNEEDTPTRVLLRMMRYDPSAEVRRAALFQIDLHPTTLPFILSRTRDIDPINRRSLYANTLAQLPNMAVLSLEQRNVIIKSGLRDREDSVKKAAAKLVGKWAGDAEDGLLGFVHLFDVLAHPKLAEEAVESVIATRQDLAIALQFPEIYWTDLSPESALLARLYVAYCKSVEDDARLEECMPVVTALAFRLQDTHELLKSLVEQLSAADEADEAIDADQLSRDIKSTTFVLRQLLEIGMLADYGDELGRRKMFTLVRDMISEATLPAELIPVCMDVLLKLSSGERDFMRVIVEVVQNVREDAAASALDEQAAALQAEDEEGEDDEEELDLNTATPEEIAEDQRKRQEKAAKKLQNQQLNPEKKETYLRCLELVRALLERVIGSLQDNATLIGLVHELIVPSVKSKEPEIREQGLICLGLCTLLDKDMALESFGLYVHQSQNTQGQLQVKIYQIVFDVLMLYGVSFLESKGHTPEVVIEFILHALNQDSPQVQATAAVGIAKLMLSGMLTDNEVLERLVLVYFAPETVDNLELRQCLSYFFPVYCYSSTANQRKMQEIFMSTFDILSGVYDELDDPSIMVSPVQLASQLIDWTDPRKAVAMEGVPIDDAIHAGLAQDILKKIYAEKEKEKRKILCQLLNKLYLPEALKDWTARQILLLADQLDDHRPLQDTVSKNALGKFTQGIRKAYEAENAPLTEEEFRKFDELHGVVEFLDTIKHENENNEDEFGYAGNDSVATTAGSGRRGRRGSATPASRGRKTPAKRARSISETPSIDSDASTPPPVTTARRSGRPAKPVARAPQPVIEEESEDEEQSEDEQVELDDDEDDESDTPQPRADPTPTTRPAHNRREIPTRHERSDDSDDSL